MVAKVTKAAKVYKVAMQVAKLQNLKIAKVTKVAKVEVHRFAIGVADHEMPGWFSIGRSCGPPYDSVVVTCSAATLLGAHCWHCSCSLAKTAVGEVEIAKLKSRKLNSMLQ